MAGYVPLEIEQYSTFSRIITIKDAAGELQNLVGSFANTEMRKSPYSLTSQIITTIVTNASNGEITLSMTPIQSGNVAPGRYLYDTILTSSTGIRTRLIEGVVVVNPGITH